MKIKTLAIVVLSALSLSSTAALADTTTVNGGTVHFKGEIVNAACAVDAGSIDQTVQLGQVRSAKLAAEGNTSSAVGFNIQLDDRARPLRHRLPLRSQVLLLMAPTLPFWRYRVPHQAASLTSAYRSSTKLHRSGAGWRRPSAALPR